MAPIRYILISIGAAHWLPLKLYLGSTKVALELVMTFAEDPTAFTDAMADFLRLPDETLAMCYVYSNRYQRFKSSSALPDFLDPYTLALACLSLASKATESPRRMREILFPAHRLLHEHQPLTVPSEQYDVLRATLVQAEWMLLRVLGFELRVPLPLDYLPRYLERALESFASTGEEYDNWGKEEKEEYGVVKDIMETGCGRACRAKAVMSCKDYQLANLFPPRTVALGCLRVVMEERGMRKPGGTKEWIDDISSRKVDIEDFEEVIERLKSV